MPLYNPSAAAAVTDATITTTDVTTNNSSTSKHGWLKKLDNSATNFMNGQGDWAAPGVSSAGLNAGTSFPGSPATNDLYFRTDLDNIYFYDGTRWLTATEFRIAGVGPDLSGTSSSTPNLGRAVIPSSVDIYVTTIDISTFIATTNDGTKYWTFTFSKVDVTNGSAVSLGSFTTAADTASNWTHHQVAVNAVVATATYFVLTGAGAKTSTPGLPSWAITYGYRLIAT